MRPQHILKYEQEILDWYQGSGRWASMPYDPSPLVQLARAQHPDRPHLADALARCTRKWNPRGDYDYYRDPRRWQRVVQTAFVVLPAGACWMVDLSADGSIHGLEYFTSDPRTWCVSRRRAVRRSAPTC